MYLAPTNQEFFAWPMWGQYYQTLGQGGYAPDMQAAKRLMLLANDWNHTQSPEQRLEVWQKMLAIHAQEQFGIGIISEAPQPIVVSKRLRNVPDEGIWAFDPGAHFGIHRIDEFYYDDPHVQVGR